MSLIYIFYFILFSGTVFTCTPTSHPIAARGNQPSNGSFKKTFSEKNSYYWTVSSPTKTVQDSSTHHVGSTTITYMGVVGPSSARSSVQSLYSTQQPTVFDSPVVSNPVLTGDPVEQGAEITSVPLETKNPAVLPVTTALTDVSSHDYLSWLLASSLQMTTLPASYGFPIFSGNTQAWFDNSHTTTMPPSAAPYNMPIIPSQTDPKYDDNTESNTSPAGSTSTFTGGGGKLGGGLASLRESEVSLTITSSCESDSCLPVLNNAITQWQHSAIQLDSQPSSTNLAPASSDKLPPSDMAGPEISRAKVKTTQKSYSEDQKIDTFTSFPSQATSLVIAVPVLSHGIKSVSTGTSVQSTLSGAKTISSISDTVNSFTFAVSETSGSTLPAQTVGPASEQTSFTSQAPNSDGSSDSQPVLSSSVEIAAGAVGGAVCLTLAVFFFTARLRRRMGTIPIKNETQPEMSHFSFGS